MNALIPRATAEQVVAARDAALKAYGEAHIFYDEVDLD